MADNSEIINVLQRAVVDSWGIFLILLLKNLCITHTNIFNLVAIFELRFPSYLAKSIKRILSCFDTDEYTIFEAFYCYTTMYVIIILCLYSVMLLGMIVYTLNHKLYTVLFFITAIFTLFFDVITYKSFYLQFIIFFSFIFFATYKIHKAFIRKNPGPQIMLETADSLVHFGFWFYFKFFFHMFCIFIKCFIIRIYDFTESNYIQQFLFICLLTYYVYSEIFVTQTYTAHMLSKKLYNDSPTFRYDFIQFFFTSSVAAIVKLFMLITNRIYFILRIILGEKTIAKYPIFKYLEDDRCHFFYIIFKRTSYFEGFSGFRSVFWSDNIRKHVQSINFKGDLLPAVICLFMALKQVFKSYPIIKPYDLAFILSINAYVITEVFNSYAVIKTLVYIKARGGTGNLQVDYNKSKKDDANDLFKKKSSDVKMGDFFDHAFFNYQLFGSEMINYNTLGEEFSDEKTVKID